MAVKIMIDSASDISLSEAEKKGVIMIPMLITFGEEEFFDGVDLLPERFYEKLVESDELPKTSQINPFRFEEEFEKHTKNGDELVVITISSKLSGTYEGAKQVAAEKFAGKVFVVDSMNAAIGERLLCDYALRLVSKGKSGAEIKEELDKQKSRINVMAMLGTLEYLKKGGRISKTVAFAGELLSLKPVVAVVEGEVKLVGKALGSKKGNNLLNRLIAERGGIDFDMPYGVVWSGFSDATLKKYVQDSAAIWQADTDEVPAYIIGGTIGTHIGPGAVGVAFFEK
ncbi:MAG: DegV family protein [Clostridia bacterium]|nr:DegV family protein [Clostridia bacterium]